MEMSSYLARVSGPSSSHSAEAATNRTQELMVHLRSAWGRFLLIGSCAAAVYFLLPSKAARGILFESIGAAGVLATIVGVRLNRPTFRAPWYLLAAGAGSFVVGDTLWDVYELILKTEPFPSIADFFYLMGYPLLMAGLILLILRRGRKLDLASLIDATMVVTGLGVLLWVFLINPYVTDPTLSTEGRLIAVAYPVLGILVAGVVARLIIGPGRRVASYMLIALAVVFQLIADVAFATLELAGSYQTGSPVDSGWLLFFVLIGTASLHPSMRVVVEPSPVWEPKFTSGRLLMLISAALLASVGMGAQVARGEDFGTPVTILGLAILLLLVLARIFERKQVEDALRVALRREHQALEEVLRLDQLKNAFLTSVSHELRTPLSSVLGYSLLLERKGEDLSSQERAEMFHTVSSNARKLERLISDLLDLEGLARGALELNRTPTDIGGLVRRVVSEADLTGRPVKLSADSVTASVDARKTERILDHLLTNVAKYTPEGAPVSVSVEASEDGVLIRVEDEGPGIPDDLKQTIFEPFTHGQEVRAHSPGTGVGLSVVSEFARLHGGRAWVEDGPGRGASFRVFLPSTAEPAEPRLVEESR